MELPQPKPLGTEGRKHTHDFLSLYPSSTSQQDPTPSQGNYIKTHDFLQPLERVTSKNTTKEAIEEPPYSSVEHILPGGIGTYTISYSQKSPIKSDQGTLFAAQTSNNTSNKNEDSNSFISYPANTFTIWDESASARKGKTGKENIATELHIPREAASKFNQKHNPTKTFGSFSDFHPSSSQKNQSFMDMITSTKNDQEDDDDDEDDGENEFVVKKEPTPSQSKGNNVSVKVEAKTTDQKPNTSRSKHSATEQRRRSKINDRFQKLREIIPNSDQKRDKASFLLEVIEYVQFLQGKANRYEDSCNIWNHETSKMMQRRNCYNGEGNVDHARRLNTAVSNVPASVHSTQLEEKKTVVSPSIPINGQNLAESDTNSSCEKGNQLQELTIESGRINISSVYSQGLLNTLTKALQSSGVDLSQATISVQIDIGNRSYNTKDSDVSTGAGEDVGQALKRLKTS